MRIMHDTYDFVKSLTCIKHNGYLLYLWECMLKLGCFNVDSLLYSRECRLNHDVGVFNVNMLSKFPYTCVSLFMYLGIPSSLLQCLPMQDVSKVLMILDNCLGSWEMSLWFSESLRLSMWIDSWINDVITLSILNKT